MAISSASTRIYNAPDPIMETDLDLLGKVNFYQQQKYDEGGKQVQDTINNWSLLADQAKPQDRQYINDKLTKMVSGINNLGGINLADQNNVNQLKNQGYNLYGDQAVMNAVITTKKLRTFMADAQAKLSGKNADKYDDTYYQYKLNDWNKWLDDGQTGSTYNGTVSLAQGSFKEYQKRMDDAVTKLTPDLDSAPVGTDAINYLQVGSKFIKKERIKELIKAQTTAQDYDIISAHAWKNLGGVDDNSLLKYTTDGYNSQVTAMKSDYNNIKHNMELSQDFEQKQRYKDQLGQLTDAMKNVDKQKKDLFDQTNGKALNDDQRTGLRSNLYFNSYLDGYATAKSYTQNKTELKTNEGRKFQLQQARQAYEFGENQKRYKAIFDLSVRKEDFEEQLKQAQLGLAFDTLQANSLGLRGPSAGIPLQLMPNLGKDDATVFSPETATTAQQQYNAVSNHFYTDAYNIIGALPGYQQYVTKNADGTFVPKDADSQKVLDQAVLNKITYFDSISKLPLSERKQYETQFTTDDQQLIARYRQLKEADLYKGQVNDLVDAAFNKKNLESPNTAKLRIDLKNGKFQEMTYSEFKDISDQAKADPNGTAAQQIKLWKDNAKTEFSAQNSMSGLFSNIKESVVSIFGGTEPTTVDQAIKKVDDYYQQGDWKGVSVDYNPYGKNINLPKNKSGKVSAPLLQTYFSDKLKNDNPKLANDINVDDVDLNKIWVQYDEKGTDSKLRYKAEVKYKKGTAKAGDKYAVVDLTTDVIHDPNSTIARMFPQDNTQLVYGLMIDKDGKTPFDASDDYRSSLQTSSNPAYPLKYQIVSKNNPQTKAVEGYKVNVLIPNRDKTGKINYTIMPVKNTYSGMSTDFPANFSAVQQYMDEYTKDENSINQFYQLHGIPIK